MMKVFGRQRPSMMFYGWGGGAVGGHIHSTLEIKGRTVGSPMTKIVDMHVGNRILRER